jgi:hypothetical protein
MEVIILGKCLNVEQFDHEFRHEIHYIGVLRAEIIKRVFLYDKMRVLKVGEDYIIHSKMIEIDGLNFRGNIIRVKNIKYFKRDIF